MTPEEFKRAIYAGGADDKVATDRGIEILTNMGMSPEEGLAFWNQALGTQLTNDDMTGALAARVPENFEDYIYAGGADDKVATDRGIELMQQHQIPMEEALDVWNTALDTSFTDEDAGLSVAARDPEAFKEYIYDGGVNDMVATDRGVELLKQHEIPLDEALTLWNDALGTDLTEETAIEALAVRDPEAFKEYIYKDGANDKLATDRGIKVFIDHQIPFDRALDLWNKSLDRSFTLNDANKALQERYMPVISESAVSSPYTSYLKGDKGAIVGDAGRSSTQDNRGLQTIGGNGPQNFFSFDAPYSSTLIKALRQSTPNPGNMNSGVTMLQNQETASGGGLAVKAPPTGLSNNVQQAAPPQAYVPSPQGGGDRSGVDDGGGQYQQPLTSGYSNPYFQANPDVAQMYERNFQTKMTPDAYAMEHWLNYGQTEGRDGWVGPMVRPGEFVFGSGNGDIYANQGA